MQGTALPAQTRRTIPISSRLGSLVDHVQNLHRRGFHRLHVLTPSLCMRPRREHAREAGHNAKDFYSNISKKTGISEVDTRAFTKR